MPVFEFQAPDGKVYEIEAPEGATEQQAFQVLQAQLAGAAGATPTPAPAAPAATGGPPGAPPGMVGAGPGGAPPAAAPGVPEAMARDPARFQQAIAAERARQQELDMQDMGAMGQFLTGMGQSVDSNIRGARQLFNMATGDRKDLEMLAQEEREARARDEPLLSTVAGRGGQVSGHVMQALLPAGVAGRGAAALGGGVGRYAMAEGIAGAGMGALQPTLDDESHATNAMVGGALGAALPVAGGVYRFGRDLGLSAARALAPRGSARFVDDLAAIAKSNRIRERAGKEISRIVEGQRVELAPMVNKLQNIRTNYGTEFPKAVNNQLDQLIQLSKVKGAKLRGEVLQEIRSAVGKEASASKGLVQSGLRRLQRTLDEGMDQILPKAKATRLREAREAYRTGVKPPSSTSNSRGVTRGFVEALRAPYGAPENQGEQ